MAMTKKYQCPNCGVAMEFHPDTQKLHCEYCKSTFTPKQMEAMEQELAEALKKAGVGVEPAETAEIAAPASDVSGEKPAEAKTGASLLMQMTILRCQSCGAELAVNGTEALTFCAFCGQATVVTDRLEGWLKPNYIIPFKVTKEEAQEAIREKLSKGRFVPWRIKHFKAERLSGIYIPYWLFDVYYADDQVWTYKKRRGKYYVRKNCRRAAECMFKDLPVDVSLHMPDGASQRLEPYDMKGLKPFNAAYLSGFYSNRFDVSRRKAKGIAVGRAAAMFDDRMKTEIGIDYPDVVSRYSSRSLSEAMNARYALLPAWIMTFREGNKPYNIMVNGQTGKVACAVPFLKLKAYLLYALLLILFCVPLGLYGGYVVKPLHNALMQLSERAAFTADVAFFGTCGYVAYYCGRAIYEKWGSFREHMKLTNSTETEQYVRERQDKTV